MSPALVTYLVSMGLLLFGQRLLAGLPSSVPVSLIGVVGLGLALGLRFRALRAVGQAPEQEGHRLAQRQALLLTAVGAVALLLYVPSAGWFLDWLDVDAGARGRWEGSFGALWPALWLVATLPLVLLDLAVRAAPALIPTRRVRETVANGVVAALGLCLVFPLNYLASEHRVSRNVAYFKTTDVGSATPQLVEALPEPITVRVFLPPTSEVLPELRGYFDQLEGPKLRVEYLDFAAHPRLVKALRVDNNGDVAFTLGEVDLAALDEDGQAVNAVTRTIRVGAELEKAKKNLRQLDQKVQAILRELATGKRVAYVTTGHGELSYKGAKRTDDRKLRELKALLGYLGFSLKQLGPGEGLAEAVPDDAGLVVVLGPTGPFREAEAEALGRFLDQGGALLVGLEPRAVRDTVLTTADERDPLRALLAARGVTFGRGVLAADARVFPIFRNRLDRLNVLTTRYSAHPVTRTLASLRPPEPMLASGAGFIEESGPLPEGVERDFVLRSEDLGWVDLDGDLNLGGAETRGARPIAAALEGPTPGGAADPEWRILATADATIFSDLGLQLFGANRQFAADAANWLVGAEALSGTTENEEDQKIEHSKEGQRGWFYATVVLVPALFMGLGLLRVRRRRLGGRS